MLAYLFVFVYVAQMSVLCKKSVSLDIPFWSLSPYTIINIKFKEIAMFKMLFKFGFFSALKTRPAFLIGFLPVGMFGTMPIFMSSNGGR
jgi:hypothetical protein